MEMRGFTVQYSKRKAKMLRDKEISLQKKVNLLQRQAEENPHNKNIIHELQVEKSRLKKIMTYRTKGAILRSKVRWHEDGERNTKYFYSLEKRNYTNKAITRLKIAENVYTEDQFNILDKEKCFYESLYKTKNIETEKLKNSPFFNLENITPLNEDERLSCEGQITSEECYNALKDFKVGKTPGTDGFPAECYRFFWPEINKEMTESFNFAF